MSEQDTGVSDANQQASGEVEEKEGDVVKYDTYRKVLSEKKKVAEKLSELEQMVQSYQAKEKERQEAELKQQNRYKEVLELREKELEETKNRLNQTQQQIEDGRKLNALLNALDNGVESKYWDKLPLDKIIVGDDGQIEHMSVTAAVEEFRKEYPEIIKPKKVPGVPNQAPKIDQPRSLGDLSVAELNRRAAELLATKR